MLMPQRLIFEFTPRVYDREAERHGAAVDAAATLRLITPPPLPLLC